jgi:serine/threonine protein kinase
MSEQRYISDQGKTYRVVKRLGAAGGFGSVVEVEDEHGARYALKTLHFGVPADVLAVEAENLRSVRHDNVVRYADFGSDPEPFVVMELATGGTLKDYIAEARQRGEHFPIDTIVEWARQMLRGLGAIHATLLHRDLKPGNVLLDGDTLKIADFGIARLVEASTRDETFKGGGTAAYMPPEGWAGRDGPSPTPAYDLYSLGVMLFEIATLQLPFGGDREALRNAHLYTEPPTPTTLRPDLPPPLERLILRLLRKTPTQRGESAGAALELLATVAEVPHAASDDTSAVLARLQEGASALMREAAEREAEMARTQQALRETRERNEAAISQFETLLDEAAALVEQNVSPLQLSRSGGRGNWRFTLEQSPRQITVQLAPPSSADFERAANLPGRIMLFGHIAISEEESRRSQTLGGSNIVGYARDDAPWVTHFQLVELTNNPIVVHPMRQYEPFFLTPDELGQHGHSLWGGALHVFQSRQIELTRDVLVEWFARLMPGSR